MKLYLNLFGASILLTAALSVDSVTDHYEDHEPPVQSNLRSMRVAFKNVDGGTMFNAFSRNLQAPVSTVCSTDSVSSQGKTLSARAIYVVNQVGTITADGDTGDWDLDPNGLDFVSYLYNQGNTNPTDSNYQVAGNLYLRWDCASQKLCALALLNSTLCLVSGGEYYKDYKWGTSSIPALSPGFQFVPSGSKYIGWEACFTPPAYTPTDSPCRPVVEFHLDYLLSCTSTGAKTGSTGRANNNDYIGLDLTCSPTPPTKPPTKKPTSRPTVKPTNKPTNGPTSRPTAKPTSKPTVNPTSKPTAKPTHNPTQMPSSSPSGSPSEVPSHAPSKTPSMEPSHRPSSRPSRAPTHTPTKSPTHSPTKYPTNTPTNWPTKPPTPAPTNACTDTAWAVWNTANTTLNCISKLVTNKWGWYLGPLTAPWDTTYSIYAGAGQCNIRKGNLTGYVRIQYTAGPPSQVVITVSPLSTIGYYASAHYYVGTDVLPKKNGVYTDAPGQFDKSKYYGDSSLLTYTENITGTVYAAVHMEWSHKCT